MQHGQKAAIEHMAVPHDHSWRRAIAKALARKMPANYNAGKHRAGRGGGQ